MTDIGMMSCCDREEDHPLGHHPNCPVEGENKPTKPMGIEYRGRIYPRFIDLQYWYLCYRKIAYDTEEIAAIVSDMYGNITHVYACPYGDHFHNGRPSKGRKNENYLRQQWNKRDNKPSLEDLRTARVLRKIKAF